MATPVSGSVRKLFRSLDMDAIKDILGMAVVGVLMTVAVPFVFMAACIWQLWEIVNESY